MALQSIRNLCEQGNKPLLMANQAQERLDLVFVFVFRPSIAPYLFDILNMVSMLLSAAHVPGNDQYQKQLPVRRKRKKFSSNLSVLATIHDSDVRSSRNAFT